MSRKSKHITITDDGRDKGKTFLLNEMSASAAEAWATKAFQGLAQSGVEIPKDLSGAGVAGIAVLGVQALAAMPYETLKPLMDEVFACVRICPDERNPSVNRPLIEEDIEEVQTRLKLRMEVLELHTGFSLAGALRRPSTNQPSEEPRPTVISRRRSQP